MANFVPFKEVTVDNDHGVISEIILESTKDGEYKLTKHINDDILEKENQEIKKYLIDRKGFSKDRTKRHIASIPWYLFLKEPLLKEYLESKYENPEYAKRCLVTWLKMNSGRRIGEGNI